jgi:hypothetical protein
MRMDEDSDVLLNSRLKLTGSRDFLVLSSFVKFCQASERPLCPGGTCAWIFSFEFFELFEFDVLCQGKFERAKMLIQEMKVGAPGEQLDRRNVTRDAKQMHIMC